MRRELTLMVWVISPLLSVTILLASCPSQATQPEPAEDTHQLPEIRDEPQTVDPASLMPEPLTVRVTADLSNSSLGEVANWLRDELGLAVLLKRNALDEVGVLPSEPVSDRLDDDPVFLLLNRLRSHQIGWYFENDVLYITSQAETEARYFTRPYPISDLLDTGYRTEDLGDVIEATVFPDSWETMGGDGTLSFLGDVMFVRQTDEVQWQVQGLLAALREHARRTFILDSPQHALYRQRLEEEVSIDFRDTPLETAVKELSDIVGMDLRLDRPALRLARVREREPVTLSLSERKLKTVLQAMVMDHDLTWVLRDGVLWITSVSGAEEFLKTAVYDVRDLCRDAAESRALLEAITSQTEASLWVEGGGDGSIHFAKPGTLVVRSQEQVLAAVLELLESYRTALRASKPRDRDGIDPDEVTTVYYRMHTRIAEDLAELMPTLVRPTTWKNEAHPDGPGEVFRVASAPEWLSTSSGMKPSSADELALLAARAVLIITQTRGAHEEIAELIRRVELGDRAIPGDDPRGGMGGMGGFGGGFFSVPSGLGGNPPEPARRP
jgi:hypothetical protein